MDKVVVYPGRFQPMLKHHAEVYNSLVKQYPDAEVYIGTSDKVEPGKSPFNFAEKQKIAQAHGIDPSRVLQVKNPYHMDSYPFDKDNTEIIFAVGEKDAEQRFPVNQTKKDGTPGYYQRMGSDQVPLPMSKRGYITVAPNVTDGGDVASASAFRQAMQGAGSPEEAKQIYTKQFGSYDPDVFNLVYNKVAGKTMEQLDLNHMRKMAGISEAPGDSENMRSSYYGMSDQQRQLADMGRALMNSQFKFDDALGNKMADVGNELTKFGTPEGSKSLEDMIRKLKMSKDELLKFMKKGKELVDQGAHEMGRGMDASDEPEQPEDDFDADADATAAVDDMEVDDEVAETALDLGEIRDDYGIAEAPDVAIDVDEEAEDTPGALEFPESEPQSAMGGATSYAGTTSYAGDEVSVSELNQVRVAAGLEPVIGEVQVGDDTADTDSNPDNNYPDKPAINPLHPVHEEGDCPTYEDQVVELMKLAGIDCNNVYVSEEPRHEREVQPQKGDNAGFGMVDRDNDGELDPIVNEGTDAVIAQKVKDMGATLDDEQGFIKHLAHVAKEMGLGKYVMNNPDFIPDVMQAFRGLEESSIMCTKCGQEPCAAAPACGAMDADEPGPNNPFPADPKNDGYHRSDVNPYNGEEMSEDNGCPCCGDGPCKCVSDCGGCECGGQMEEDQTDEAIGDGFLSGNQAIGRVLRQMLELEEMVEAYQERLGMAEGMDERFLTPAQRKAGQMGTAILRAKNRIANHTGRLGDKTTVVSDPYADQREESVQEDAIETTMEELKKLAGL